MSVRSSVVTFALVALAGLVALLIAGSSDQRSTAFSLDLPNVTPVTSVARGFSACQGPLPTVTTFQGVRAWLSPAAAPVLSVTVRDEHGRRLAAGTLATEPGVPGAYISRLDAPVASGTRAVVCLRNLGPGPVAVFGSTPTPASGPLRVASTFRAGTPPPSPVAIALVFLRPHSQSLLSLLPTLFSRASLFKASWVGAWTFWVLCGAILGAFLLAGCAVALAARDRDERDDDQRNSARATRQ